MLKNFFQRAKLRKAATTSLNMAVVVFTVVKSNLWPLYSASVLTSAFYLLCSSMEKQVLADHLFGDSKKMEAEKSALLENSRQLFHEELSTAIKERVWQLPRDVFLSECKERNIS